MPNFDKMFTSVNASILAVELARENLTKQNTESVWGITPTFEYFASRLRPLISVYGWRTILEEKENILVHTKIAIVGDLEVGKLAIIDAKGDLWEIPRSVMEAAITEAENAKGELITIRGAQRIQVIDAVRNWSLKGTVEGILRWLDTAVEEIGRVSASIEKDVQFANALRSALEGETK